MTTVLDITTDRRLLRGRGALSNHVGRYEKQARVLVDDGWDDGWRDEDGTPPPLRTEVIVDATRTIIARNKSPDISFDRSINPYRGCEHGCIYCFARPSHAYLGLSPGLDFETRIFVKEDAPDLLAAELSKPSYDCKAITLGANTDVYQPVESPRGELGFYIVSDGGNRPYRVRTRPPSLYNLQALKGMATGAFIADLVVQIGSLDPVFGEGYPGGGSTIGPGMVFGFLGGVHAGNRSPRVGRIR